MKIYILKLCFVKMVDAQLLKKIANVSKVTIYVTFIYEKFYQNFVDFFQNFQLQNFNFSRFSINSALNQNQSNQFYQFLQFCIQSDLHKNSVKIYKKNIRILSFKFSPCTK